MFFMYIFNIKSITLSQVMYIVATFLGLEHWDSFLQIVFTATDEL